MVSLRDPFKGFSRDLQRSGMKKVTLNHLVFAIWRGGFLLKGMWQLIKRYLMTRRGFVQTCSVKPLGCPFISPLLWLWGTCFGSLTPWKIHMEPFPMEVRFRWFSFSNEWRLDSMLLFEGVVGLSISITFSLKNNCRSTQTSSIYPLLAQLIRSLSWIPFCIFL